VKKSLNFACLGIERDPVSDNFLLLLARINEQTVILGSIYGPNEINHEFFRNLSIGLHNLGEFPIICGGDWNATFSCLPVAENLDILNMEDVPNINHSRKIRELCREFNLTDPYRVINPNKKEFSYAPWGNIRNNRSRLDFFLASKSIIPLVGDCCIKPNVQSKLFDHKAILLDFRPKSPTSARPTISSRILLDPDLDFLVQLSVFECYIQNLSNEQNDKEEMLGIVGNGFHLLRAMGPDPNELMYSYAKLVDVDVRVVLKDELRGVIANLEARGIPDMRLTVEPDIFLELLINNIRNEVISYQAFIFRKVREN